MKSRAWFIFFCCSLLTACIDPFDIGDVVDGQPRLVVDGLLTDQAKIHQVEISYSSPTLNTFEVTPVTNAQVIIEDENGNQVLLNENPESPGTYETSPDFAGTVGLAYTLLIRTSENVSYRSTPEVMRPVAAIENIYAEPASRTTLSSIGTLIDEWGMEFYVDTGTGLSESNFYRWEWEETYEFIAPLMREIQLEVPICYQSGRSFRSLLISSSQDFTVDRIERQPITFASKRGYKLQRRYSLLVKQYSLTEKAYNFWSDIDEQRNSDGSLFDPPPSRILGNLVRDDDPNETVLGYFQVSATTERRFFLSRSQVPVEPGGPVQGFSICSGNFVEPPAGGGDPGDNPDPGPPDFCYDCRLISGATTIQPDFWR